MRQRPEAPGWKLLESAREAFKTVSADVSVELRHLADG